MKVKILQQSKRGKFNAVLEGASIAKGKMILIWDADGTVSSFDTIRIIELAFDTKGPVIGNRLRGTIAPGAMRRANFLGNWVFAFMWSPILLDTPKDMLCGTKIFDIETFTHLPRWLINADPYGDFALVAFAKSRGLRIQSLPVDYHSRKYGETNIHRWSGGYALLKCTFKIYYWLLIGRKSKPKSQQKLV
jgi:glycosyltransferase involved in cell wall biosynthesis